jgi:hypothetical protein
MAPTISQAGNPPAPEASSVAVGAFMLTLCRLEAPIAIRPSQNPQLARFKFFMSRARQADGNQQLYLHMGYFPTLGEAEKCAQVMRARYPQAVATEAPPGLSRPAGVASAPVPPQPPVLHGIPPADANALTDTQVLRILETRRVDPGELGKRPPDRPEISLLRPDDTNTRRALKEAVVQGAPISFVVQLCRSDEPIKLGTIPSLDIFRAYTLYLAEGALEGRSWHALRLGFFTDAISAKQVAHYAQTRFTSVAVLPINEPERVRASQKPIALTLLARSIRSSIDDVLAADQANTEAAAAEKSKSLSASKPASASPPPGVTENKSATTGKHRRKDSLEQTLDMLAESELWSNTDPESLSETGVRHLKIQVQKRNSRA